MDKHDDSPKQASFFIMVACALFRRVAVDQRVISLQHSLFLIKNQTGVLSQETHTKHPHIAVYLSCITEVHFGTFGL